MIITTKKLLEIVRLFKNNFKQEGYPGKCDYSLVVSPKAYERILGIAEAGTPRINPAEINLVLVGGFACFASDLLTVPTFVHRYSIGDVIRGKRVQEWSNKIESFGDYSVIAGDDLPSLPRGGEE